MAAPASAARSSRRDGRGCRGSLWPHALIEESRIVPPRDAFVNIVIGVDPPVTAEGNERGIVACALGRDGIACVVGDHSEGGLSPEQWARKVAGAAERWQADRLVAEGNPVLESKLAWADRPLP